MMKCTNEKGMYSDVIIVILRFRDKRMKNYIDTKDFLLDLFFFLVEEWRREVKLEELNKKHEIKSDIYHTP